MFAKLDGYTYAFGVPSALNARDICILLKLRRVSGKSKTCCIS
jgi:hypothetical protein